MRYSTLAVVARGKSNPFDPYKTLLRMGRYLFLVGEKGSGEVLETAATSLMRQARYPGSEHFKTHWFYCAT